MIRLTLALTFFNFVGVTAARVVLSLFALALGAPASAVGVLAGIFYVFPLLLSLAIGNAADRYGPRWLLAIGAVCGTAALLLPYFVRQIPAFYAAAALSGLSLAFNHVTLQNLMGTLSKPEDRARNFSNFSLIGSVVNFVGPLVAGFSIDHAGHAVACLYLAALSLVPFLLLAIWGRSLPRGHGSAQTGKGAALDSLREPGVWRMLTASGLVQLGTDLFQFYLPIHGHARGLSASAIGAVLACFAAASFLVRLFLPGLVKRFSPERLLAWSFYMGAAGFVMMAFFGDARMLAVTAFVFGLGMGVGTPISVMLMFSQSAQGRSGQALGLRLTTNNLMRVAGTGHVRCSRDGVRPGADILADRGDAGIRRNRGGQHAAHQVAPAKKSPDRRAPQGIKSVARALTCRTMP
jgi:MFS family permease